MKVVLIYPRFSWEETGPLQEPLGILYLASSLKKAGFEPRVLDLSFAQDLNQLDSELKGAHLVGVSSSSALLGRAIWVLEKIRQLQPSLPVVIGGPHPSADPLSALKQGFDYAVVGEGEGAIVELAEELAGGRDGLGLKGIWARKNREVIPAEERGFIPDINQISFPARDLLDYAQYFARGMIQVGVMLSRGCPHKCRFCKPMQDKLFGRKIRKRSPENVAEELELAVKITGRNFFLFRDDNLTSLGKEWFERFCRELEQRRLKIYFSAQARVNEIDEELILLMKSCGLVGIAFGAESGSQKILDYYQKGIRVEDTVRAFELCKKHKIGTHCFIILGAPQETKEDLAQTIELVKRIQPDSLSLSRLTPAPGTYLFDEAKNNGILNCSDWEEWNYFTSRTPIRWKYLDEKDLEDAEQTLRRLVPGSAYYLRRREKIKRRRSDEDFY